MSRRPASGRRLAALAAPAAPAALAALLTGALVASGTLAGCSAATASRDELVVFAAASLNGSFTELAADFEQSHAGAKVKYSFDGSAALVDQLKAGAPADVFASADAGNMAKATGAGLVDAPKQFTTNVLTLIVPKGNPAAITGLDASLGGKKLVVCADGVPCGSATLKLAEALGVTLEPVSEETKVTDVRTKVESGQADAGIVYVTDAKASADLVEAIPVAGAEQARNDYLIGAVKTSKRAALAADFISLVQSERGQAVLKAAGFGQ